jgi:hypothetical protein
MDGWVFQTGHLDENGNYVDKADPTEDKYWQKYMSEASPYKAKYSPPAKAKSPNGKAGTKRYKGKKKPRWMTNEEYERLTVKSYSKKHSEPPAEDSYYNNGGEPLRWPENLQQRPHSPAYKHAVKTHAGNTMAREGNETDDSNLEELNAIPRDIAKGAYRPSSAPLGKTPVKNLFRKQGPGTFFNDLLVAPPAYPLTKHAAGSPNRPKSRETSPSSRGRKLKIDDEYAPGMEDEDGIMEYGDTYVIENEEEAIKRIQTAMVTAAARTASPNGRTRTKREQEVLEEEVKKIGAGLYVAGELF